MKKVGRNDPCPCGSNKKYKQCCLPHEEFLSGGARSGNKALPAAQAFQIALEHHKAGRLLQAESIYRKILQKEPNHPDTLHALGMIAFQVGRSEEAVDLIGRAIQAYPSDPHYHSNLAIALQHQGKLEEAVASYQKALGLKPDFAEVYGNLGKAYRDQGKLKEAEESSRKALTLRPDLAEALINLGNALLDQGQLDEAVASYRKALLLNPDYAEAHYNLGNALLEQGKMDEAVASYRQALSLKPDLIQAHLSLGNVLRDQGELDEALASYKQALSLNPFLPQAYINLGNALQDQGKPDEAVVSYRQALSFDPDSAQAHLNLGNAFREGGRIDEAIASYQKVIQIDPGNIIATHILTALSGGDSACSPGKYVEVLFDHMADRFDKHLLHNLKYNVPEELVRMIRGFSKPPVEKWDVLDLGCGTGLVGVAIAPYARRLTGVDLSPRMLAKARDRDIYHRLERSDLVSMMQGEGEEGYDVVIATDVFIYIGDLDNVMGQARRLLRRNGIFGFSLENLDLSLDYKLMPTTRYAHSPAYIEKLAVQYGFHIHRMVPTQIRLENDGPVQGWLVLLGG